MKKLLIAVLVVSAAAVAVESSAASNADDAIKQVYVQLDDCATKSDAKCIAELFAEDGTFLERASGRGKIVKGKAQILKTLQDLMGAPNTKGAKQTHAVESVRMICEDHAIVDSVLNIAGVTGAGPREHAIAVMVLKGDRWLFEDIRSYVVANVVTNEETAPPAKTEPSPPPKKEPAQPED